MQRILLGQLLSNGDCLYATILARQIRVDHPDAHITWAVSSLCSGLLRGNPHVDAVWEIPTAGWEYHEVMWRVFEREAVRRTLRHEFDHAYLSQIFPNNFHNYDGTVRPSILRNYGRPITVPIENVIVLEDSERDAVEAFARTARLADVPHRILFECSSKSGQSFMTPELAQVVADHIYATLPDALVMFSTHEPMTLRHERSRYAGNLSLREIAGLTNHCTLFVGCGSGGTVAATSTAGRRLPMIQLLLRSTAVYASFKHDFEYFGLPSDHIVEMTRQDPAEIAAAIVMACREGVSAAQARFEERITPGNFEHYRGSIRTAHFRRGRFLDALASLKVTVERYGPAPALRDFGLREIGPNLMLDPDWIHRHRREPARCFLDQLAKG